VPNINECKRTPRRARGSRVPSPHVSPRSAFLVVAILLAAASRLVPHPPNFTPLGAIILFDSCVRFVVTNAACWAPWHPRTLTGLSACYIMAIPFYGDTLLGDGLSTAVLFAAPALGEQLVPALRERPLGGLSPATI
jgi:hypothetical protein